MGKLFRGNGTYRVSNFFWRGVPARIATFDVTERRPAEILRRLSHASWYWRDEDLQAYLNGVRIYSTDWAPRARSWLQGSSTRLWNEFGSLT